MKQFKRTAALLLILALLLATTCVSEENVPLTEVSAENVTPKPSAEIMETAEMTETVEEPVSIDLPEKESEIPEEPETSEDPEASEVPETSEDPIIPEGTPEKPEGETVEEFEETEDVFLANISDDNAETEEAVANITGGTCGSGVIWKIEGSKLIISGKGKMNDYAQDATTPWQSKANQIDTLIVKRGVTKLGSCAFMKMPALRTVKLAEGVTDINSSAFAFCVCLSTLYVPQSLKYVHRYAFRLCGDLSIYYAGDEEQFNHILYDSNDDWEQNSFLRASVWYAGIDWVPEEDPDFADDVPIVEMGKGTLQAVNVKKRILTIDGGKYSVKQSFAKSMNTLLKDKKIKDKTVVFKLKNFSIVSIYSIYDVAKIDATYNEYKDTTDLVYEDGAYSKSRLENLAIDLCLRSTGIYTEEELRSVRISLTADHLYLKTNSNYLYFGTRRGVKQKTATVSIPETTLGIGTGSYNATVNLEAIYVRANKAPKKAKIKELLYMEPQYVGNTYKNYKWKNRYKISEIYIENYDLQGKALEKERNKQLEKLENSLANTTAIELGSELEGYLSKSCGYSSAKVKRAMKAIQQFLTLYITEATASTQADSLPNSWIEKMEKFLEDSAVKELKSLAKNLGSKMLSKLGLNSGVLPSYSNMKLNPIVMIEDTEIDFEISSLEFSSGGTPYAKMAKVDFSIKGTHVKGTGIFTGVNMENFASIMMNFLRIVYNNAWGTNADEIAKELIQQPFDKLLFGKGTFSGKIFTVMLNAAKDGKK